MFVSADLLLLLVWFSVYCSDHFTLGTLNDPFYITDRAVFLLHLIEFKVCRCRSSNKPFSLSNTDGPQSTRALNSHTVLETIRIELLDPHMAAVTWVTCEAQWQAADIKVFISFPQFTIYSAWLTSQLPFSTTTKDQLLVCVPRVQRMCWRTHRWVVFGWPKRLQKPRETHNATLLFIMIYIICTTIRWGLFEWFAR